MPTLSIMGLYSYDNTIFDNFNIPTFLDSENIIDNILMELAEFEILYTNPDFMKIAIGIWSKKEIEKWNNIYTALKLEYNPIENYNRTDIEKINFDSSKDTLDEINKDYESNRDAVSEEKIIQNTDENITRSVAGFNEQLPQVAEINKDVFENNNNTDSSYYENITNKDNTDRATYESGNNKTDRNFNSSGNIGVLTTQQMITQELELRKFNIIDYIIESFKIRFCILVY